MAKCPVAVLTNNAPNHLSLLLRTPKSINKHIRGSKTGWHHQKISSQWLHAALGSFVISQSAGANRQWYMFLFLLGRDQMNQTAGVTASFYYANVAIFISTAGT